MGSAQKQKIRAAKVKAAKAAKAKAAKAAKAKAAKGKTQTAAQVQQLRDMTAAMLAKGNAQQALDTLLDVVEHLHEDNARLTYRLSAATRALFGRSTEKINAENLGQLVLAWGGTEEQAAQTDPDVPTPATPTEEGDNESGDTPDKPREKKKRPAHPGRTQLEPDLPRNITLVNVPDDERNCVHCAVEMTPIGFIDHERVRFVPASIEVDVERRETLACKAKECKQDIVTSNRQQSRPYQRRAGPSLLAHLLESKCDDALPVYRQQDQFRRLGFTAPLNTLYGYWTHAAQLLQPVADAILSTVLSAAIVGVDDTKLDYLNPEGPKTKQRGHLWCFEDGGKLVAFTFTKTWCAEDVVPWIGAITGYIQCDDYKGYGSIVEMADGEKRILVPPDRRLGCMMHVRRRFHAALKGGHLGAAVPIKMVADIYKIEAQAKERKLDVAGRLKLRQLESLPLLAEFDQWVDENRLELLPKSPLGSAARYAFNQREFVGRCFTDGRFEIDNGRTEREIREPAIGRKNFLFAGSPAAAERLAVAYTVVLSARHVGLPVRDYLIDILTKLEAGWPIKRLGELMPDRWGVDRGLIPADVVGPGPS